MTTSIFIPEKIKVGFQHRSDTYTNNLAYVIYYDEKGKLRKENSWESWRDKSIEPKSFTNDPIEGFVLNKKVGGYRYYDYRQTYIRVYDPRGFEFEINVQNLLYILENQSCSKGKVLEGKYVYGWNGKDLILVPIDAPEYNEITAMSNKVLSGEAIKPSELKAGRTYKDKKNKLFIYLGRYDFFEHENRYFEYKEGLQRFLKDNTDWVRNKENVNYYAYKPINKGLYFWFIDVEERSICPLRTVSKRFYEEVDSNVHPNFSYFIDVLRHYEHYSPLDMEKSYFRILTVGQVEEKLEDLRGFSNRLQAVINDELNEAVITYNSDNTYTIKVWTNTRKFIYSRPDYEYKCDNVEQIIEKFNFGVFVPVLQNGMKREYFWNLLKDYEF